MYPMVIQKQMLYLLKKLQQMAMQSLTREL